MATQAAGAPPVITSREFYSNGFLVVNLGECFHARSLGADTAFLNEEVRLAGSPNRISDMDVHFTVYDPVSVPAGAV
jgi:hypothetical protein